MKLRFCDFRCRCPIFLSIEEEQEEQEAAVGFVRLKGLVPRNVVIAVTSDQHSQEYVSCDD